MRNYKPHPLMKKVGANARSFCAFSFRNWIRPIRSPVKTNPPATSSGGLLGRKLAQAGCRSESRLYSGEDSVLDGLRRKLRELREVVGSMPNYRN